MLNRPSSSVLERHIESLNRVIESLSSKNDVLIENNSKLAETTRTQSQENQRLREKCEELAKFIKELQSIPTQFASGPLWMSEEEEDARYKHDQGQITGQELRETLESLGLEPHIEVTV